MIKRLLSIIFFFCTAVSFAQVNDAGLWADIAIEKRFNQAFSLEYSHSSRFNENITELGSFINEIGLKYRLNKNNRISFSYRSNMQKQLNNMYIPYNRFYLDYTHKSEIWGLGLDLRFRFQTQHRTVDFLDYRAETSNAFRTRIKVTYDYMKFEPYVLFETFHPVWEDEYQPCEKIRFASGVEYSINKHNKLDIGYMIQKEVFEKNPYADFVFKIGYKFRF